MLSESTAAGRPRRTLANKLLITEFEINFILSESNGAPQMEFVDGWSIMFRSGSIDARKLLTRQGRSDYQTLKGPTVTDCAVPFNFATHRLPSMVSTTSQIRPTPFSFLLHRSRSDFLPEDVLFDVKTSTWHDVSAPAFPIETNLSEATVSKTESRGRLSSLFKRGELGAPIPTRYTDLLHNSSR